MARFKKVMVATRGESAVRVIRACMELGLPTVTIYTEQDANAIHLVKAGQASLVTPGPVAGYLDFAQIIDKARLQGVGSGRRDKQVLFINIGDRIEEIGV